MTTKREQVLVALHAYLTTAVPSLTFVRNPALADMLDGKSLALRDGSNELVEEFINGPIYEFTMTPTIAIVFEKDETNIDAQIDDAIGLVSAALDAAVDLGGLVEAIRVQPAELASQEIFGSADLKGAELTVEIDYWTDKSVG